MFRREIIVNLDEDFQEIFKPFYYVQLVYCVQPYNIKGGYATPLKKINVIPAVGVNILIAILFGAAVKNTNFWDETAKEIYCWTYSQYVHCFMLVTFLNFYQNKTNFTLLQNLQEVSQRIRNAEDKKRLKITSWTCYCALIAFYACLVLFKLKTDYWHWTRGLFLMTTIIFEVKLVNVAMILYFLILKLRKWQRLVIELNVLATNEETLNNLKCIFQNIIAVFTLFKKTFQGIVLFHFVMTFFQSLVYIEILIFSSKTAPDEAVIIANHVIGVLSWIIKGILIELHFCVTCELFYREIEFTRDFIIQKTGVDCDETIRNKDYNRFGKCVRRIIDTNFTRMTACGMFAVDVALPLRLTSLVATYALVLLQFALTPHIEKKSWMN